MIGQIALKKKIQAIIEMNKMPRFCLFVGIPGSGKKTFMRWVAKQLPAYHTIEFSDCKADTVRKMIEESYRNVSPTIYIMPDIQNMSAVAKNAILKITEEPPNKAYFLFSVSSIENTLETVKSRSVVFNMLPYSKEELSEYLDKQTIRIDNAGKHFILDISNTIADVKNLLSIDFDAFQQYVELVFNKIATVSGPNSFKMSDKLALKNEEDKYDLGLFFQAFQALCLQHMIGVDLEDEERYFEGVQITSKYAQELQITGINKQMLIDGFILDIRKAWM